MSPRFKMSLFPLKMTQNKSWCTACNPFVFWGGGGKTFFDTALELKLFSWHLTTENCKREMLPFYLEILQEEYRKTAYETRHNNCIEYFYSSIGTFSTSWLPLFYFWVTLITYICLTCSTIKTNLFPLKVAKLLLYVRCKLHLQMVANSASC